ncbi:ABC-type transporter, integral membrane subunit [Acidithiobacillus ferrivorans SS3]|uniref:ABC-type transporter, integral membrane subunit n=2 Tax=Acidithiobacillus ferrivorans TaxID=160808 RepID=G0JPQ8_9PROT|nr:ABC transporter permease [Acidithiobacillus ferrivorans]AEM47383.1 ABC-type transporter, integral membrane subunit [Acidithiobacillus ferrivorans SS3]
MRDAATFAIGASRQPPARWLAPLTAAAVLVFLLAPFAALVFATDWHDFHFAPGDLGAIRVSLLYSGLALMLVVLAGTPLAWWLAHCHYRGKWLVDALLLLPLLTPPLAMGILLSSFYGPYAPVGGLFRQAGLYLTNTAPAFVLAQIYGAMPYYVLAARAAFEGVSEELEQISRTLGRNRWQTFWLVTLPLARLGLTAGVALAWVRAMGEFGIVLIVAYFPQGIPVKLWVNLQDIGLSAVYPLLWVFFLVALPLPLWLGLRSRRQGMF